MHEQVTSVYSTLFYAREFYREQIVPRILLLYRTSLLFVEKLSVHTQLYKTLRKVWYEISSLILVKSNSVLYISTKVFFEVPLEVKETINIKLCYCEFKI